MLISVTHYFEWNSNPVFLLFFRLWNNNQWLTLTFCSNIVLIVSMHKFVGCSISMFKYIRGRRDYVWTVGDNDSYSLLARLAKMQSAYWNTLHEIRDMRELMKLTSWRILILYSFKKFQCSLIIEKMTGVYPHTTPVTSDLYSV